MIAERIRDSTSDPERPNSFVASACARATPLATPSPIPPPVRFGSERKLRARWREGRASVCMLAASGHFVAGSAFRGPPAGQAGARIRTVPGLSKEVRGTDDMADPVSKNQLLQTARKSVPEITPADLARELSSRKPILVDVREKDEMDAGILPGARKIPRGFLELRIEEAVPERDADVVLYCAGGTRSLLAARTLQDMGYSRVRSLAGGFGGGERGRPSGGRPVPAPRAARHPLHRPLPIPGT